jgi:pyridoxal phosphate enzyme (YggS family)
VELRTRGVELVPFLGPEETLREAIDAGALALGENKVQEADDKIAQLGRSAAEWHLIGHLQSNKVKYIAPFIHLIHGIDSFNLLKEVNKQAVKNNRIIDCLLQMHISKEETKFGLNENELIDLITVKPINELTNVQVNGLMGMASFTEDNDLIKTEFSFLKNLFDKYAQRSTFNFQLSTLSMGMSADFAFALDAGSNMVRIGSLLFGQRNFKA